MLRPRLNLLLPRRKIRAHPLGRSRISLQSLPPPQEGRPAISRHTTLRAMATVALRRPRPCTTRTTRLNPLHRLPIRRGRMIKRQSRPRMTTRLPETTTRQSSSTPWPLCHLVRGGPLLAIINRQQAAPTTASSQRTTMKIWALATRPCRGAGRRDLLLAKPWRTKRARTRTTRLHRSRRQSPRRQLTSVSPQLV